MVSGVTTALFGDSGFALVSAILAGGLGALAGCFGGLKLGGRVAATLAQQPSSGAKPVKQMGSDGGELDDMGGATGLYLKVLRHALRHPAKVLAGAVSLLLASWMLYGAFGQGVEFFPEVEPEQAIVQVHARGNLSVQEKVALVAEVEHEVLAIHDERGEFDTIYTTAGNLSSNDDDQAEDVVGRIQLELADWDVRRPADEILEEIRTRTAYLAGIHIEARKPRAGPPVGKPVQVQLSSRNPDLLEAEAANSPVMKSRFDQSVLGATMMMITSMAGLPSMFATMAIARAASN